MLVLFYTHLTYISNYV